MLNGLKPSGQRFTRAELRVHRLHLVDDIEAKLSAEDWIACRDLASELHVLDVLLSYLDADAAMWASSIQGVTDDR